jgi:hypothetical protein
MPALINNLRSLQASVIEGINKLTSLQHDLEGQKKSITFLCDKTDKAINYIALSTDYKLLTAPITSSLTLEEKTKKENLDIALTQLEKDFKEGDDKYECF